MEEIWKDVPEYEGLYQVNQFGDVFSFHTNKKLKWSLSSDGYKQYIFYKSGKKKCVFAHKLVALAFIPNPENLPLVNHKDEDKLNCFVDNLEWCTYQYNTNYNGNRSSQAIFQNRSKTIYVYDCNMNFIGEVQGMRKFAREHNISSGSLTNVLSYNSKHPNKFHSCKGFIPFYEKLQKPIDKSINL